MDSNHNISPLKEDLHISSKLHQNVNFENTYVPLVWGVVGRCVDVRRTVLSNSLVQSKNQKKEQKFSPVFRSHMKKKV